METTITSTETDFPTTHEEKVEFIESHMVTWEKLAWYLTKMRWAARFDFNDLRQHVLIKAWEAIETFDPTRGASLKTHCCIQAKGRSMSKFRNRSVDAKSGSGEEAIGDGITLFDTMQDHMSDGRTKTEVTCDTPTMFKMIAEVLDEKEQRAIMMKYGIGPYDKPHRLEEIGKTLTATVSSYKMTAHTTIARALRKLRDVMTKEDMDRK
jgi:DNA-directed RNA polymerase sigma subunit (sigma70/sigma32)